jgi:hypothetical protein
VPPFSRASNLPAGPFRKKDRMLVFGAATKSDYTMRDGARP